MLIIGFVTAFDFLQRHDPPAARIKLMLVVLAGFLAARIIFILHYLDAFEHDWFSALAFWQGGFTIWAGFAGAALTLLWRLRQKARLLQGLGLLAACAAAWFIITAWAVPAPRAVYGLGQISFLQPANPTELRNIKGPLVINLWATWCPPCRRELPMLAQVAAHSDTPILLVNEGETAEQVRAYLRKNHIPSSSVLLDIDSAMMRRNGSEALPTTLFVDSQGRIVRRHVGEISRAVLAAGIDQMKGE
ncbi:MAG: TlpA disulfide reductase family protein [Sphingomonadaceae bacterium]